MNRAQTIKQIVLHCGFSTVVPIVVACEVMRESLFLILHHDELFLEKFLGQLAEVTATERHTLIDLMPSYLHKSAVCWVVDRMARLIPGPISSFVFLHAEQPVSFVLKGWSCSDDKECQKELNVRLGEFFPAGHLVAKSIEDLLKKVVEFATDVTFCYAQTTNDFPVNDVTWDFYNCYVGRVDTATNVVRISRNPLQLNSFSASRAGVSSAVTRLITPEPLSLYDTTAAKVLLKLFGEM